MSTTEELLARLVNLENEAVQARQRQGSADRHAHTGQAEDCHWSASGIDNLAIHVQGVCVRDARKKARIL